MSRRLQEDNSLENSDPEDLRVQPLYNHKATYTCCASVCTTSSTVTAFLFSYLKANTEKKPDTVYHI